MFSATEPLASSPLATSGTTKLVNGAGTLLSPAHDLNGIGERRKQHYAYANLDGIAQTIMGTSQRIRVLQGSGDLSAGSQFILGSALYTRIIQGSATLLAASQEVSAICYVTVRRLASGSLSNAHQTLSAFGVITKTANGIGTLSGPPQTIAGSGTRIRVQLGSGSLLAAPQTLYGSELTPIWIKTKSAPLNIYDVSLHKTSEPYSTTNHYLTIYQVPGYLEQQADGRFIERRLTAIITGFSAATADLTPQPISLIIIKVDGMVVYPLIPSYDVTNGVQNTLPLRDLNLVTGDVIQVKALSSGTVTVDMSMLVNTHTYFEVI